MFRNLFTRSRPSETSAPQPVESRSLTLEDLFGVSEATAGVTVSPTTAMRAPAVRAAVTAISEACGQLPLAIVETAGGLRKPAENHPLSPILNGAANGWTPAPAFREQLCRDALLYGAGFAWIARDGTGAVRELVRVRPVDITVDLDVTDPLGPPIYRLQGRRVDGRDLLHLRCPLGPDGANGVGPVQDAREAIGLALALEQTEASIVKNAAKPGGIVSFADRLTPEQIAQRGKLWKATFGRIGQGGTAVLDAGGKFDPLTFNLVDAQFAELRAFQLAEVARAFRIPPVLLQDYGRATWSNSSEMMRIFVNLTLQPWLLRIEGEFALKLFTEEERTHLVFEHDVDQLVNSDPRERAETAQAWRAAGIKTSNECRVSENLPPRPDGDTLDNPNTTSTTTAGGPANG